MLGGLVIVGLAILSIAVLTVADAFEEPEGTDARNVRAPPPRDAGDLGAAGRGLRRRGSMGGAGPRCESPNGWGWDTDDRPPIDRAAPRR